MEEWATSFPRQQITRSGTSPFRKPNAACNTPNDIQPSPCVKWSLRNVLCKPDVPAVITCLDKQPPKNWDKLWVAVCVNDDRDGWCGNWLDIKVVDRDDVYRPNPDKILNLFPSKAAAEGMKSACQNVIGKARLQLAALMETRPGSSQWDSWTSSGIYLACMSQMVASPWASPAYTWAQPGQP